MKRRSMRERDEAAGREQAERRLEDLLTRLKEGEAAARAGLEDEASSTGADTKAADTDPVGDQKDEAAR